MESTMQGKLLFSRELQRMIMTEPRADQTWREIDTPPTHYHLKKVDEEAVQEKKRSFNINGNEESWYELFSPDGMHFHYINATVPEDKIFRFSNSTPIVQLCFSVFGRTEHIGEESETFASLNDHEYNLIYIPSETATLALMPNRKIETFTINILPELFERYAPEHHALFRKFNSIVTAANAATISDYNLPITPTIRSLLFEILNCPLNNHYKKLYLRAKTMELLMLLFNHYEEYQHETVSPSSDLREIDVKRMQHAREVLHDNIQNPCSLIDLAHQVGTNENYLKKHFKQVFGHTVYGYVQELRMQQAKQMLLKENSNIHTVATMAGYKHTHHFIAAFKKYFGYAPVKIRSLLPAFWIGIDGPALCDLALGI